MIKTTEKKLRRVLIRSWNFQNNRKSRKTNKYRRSKMTTENIGISNVQIAYLCAEPKSIKHSAQEFGEKFLRKMAY